MWGPGVLVGCGQLMHGMSGASDAEPVGGEFKDPREQTGKPNTEGQQNKTGPGPRPHPALPEDSGDWGPGAHECMEKSSPGPQPDLLSPHTTLNVHTHMNTISYIHTHIHTHVHTHKFTHI